jgi:tRNA threonylcarbamoyladenosine biosynthesis protein TsaB
MNIMAIETATEAVGVALCTEGGVRAELTVAGRRRHVESLAPAMQHLLDQVGLQPGDLDAVAVDVGPGLFTGLRVGVSAAKGLALALGLTVFGVTSLEILIRAAAEAGHRGPVLAVVDARRSEVFAALCDVQADGTTTVEVLGPSLFTPADLVKGLIDQDRPAMVAVGGGAQRYADVLGAVPGLTTVMDALSFPPPSTLVNLGLENLLEGKTPDDPRHLVPLYMREADARSNFAQIRRA